MVRVYNIAQTLSHFAVFQRHPELPVHGLRYWGSKRRESRMGIYLEEIPKGDCGIGKVKVAVGCNKHQGSLALTKVMHRYNGIPILGLIYGSGKLADPLSEISPCTYFSIKICARVFLFKL